ncbi:hypothetical protein FRB95_005996 [Tulasnella sp. JGI-2019a]|nr:hypothetical protein FRB95_005996 [Tulasnella sp. JGI-2019a]
MSNVAVGPYDPNNLPEGVYHWKIDQDQAARLSGMLNVDFATLGVSGTYVMHPQVECHGCGKLSGLDDFVNGALKFGIHSTKFMVDSLLGDEENKSPAHKLECCVCGTTFLERNIVGAKQPGWFDIAKQIVYEIGSAFTAVDSEKVAIMRWAGYWKARGPVESEPQDVASFRWAGYWKARAPVEEAATFRWAGYWAARTTDDANDAAALFRWAGYWKTRGLVELQEVAVFA